MAEIAVLASGSGSNFQNIVEFLSNTPHKVTLLITDRKQAFALERAHKLGIPARYIPYVGRSRAESEEEIQQELLKVKPDFIVLAGFMRILSPLFISQWKDKIVNIHPALLPRHPGAHGIRDSFLSNDSQLGVTVHLVDEGVDTGKVLGQSHFTRESTDTLESVELKLHALEYDLYPKIILQLCEANRFTKEIVS